MLHHPGNFLLQIPFPPSAVCFEICMYAELCLHLGLSLQAMMSPLRKRLIRLSAEGDALVVQS